MFDPYISEIVNFFGEEEWIEKQTSTCLHSVNVEFDPDLATTPTVVSSWPKKPFARSGWRLTIRLVGAKLNKRRQVQLLEAYANAR